LSNFNNNTLPGKIIGRPIELKNPKMTALYLERDQVEYVKRVGEQNVSRGMRKIIEAYRFEFETRHALVNDQTE
jgi:hypothetical protein